MSVKSVMNVGNERYERNERKIRMKAKFADLAPLLKENVYNISV